jgi:membrane-bound serine protease (ClpP class)
MTELFFILLLAGLLLIGLEVFLPGGILGLFGSLALFGAIITAFQAFGAQMGFMTALGIIILLAVFLILWIRYFPRTPIGRALTLHRDSPDFKATGMSRDELMGRTGTAITALRPSGIARIAGTRMDVVADSGWIDKEATVEVVQIQGNHVTVRERMSISENESAEPA